ncbi:MAG: glycosyltransferase [Saprospiraceae bacterium]|nr:glycosyltransferase [Saprospiraceae bacterium]MCB9320968.1 glycosyltransferase [Lewinellaceae bacterium]
MKNSNVLFAMIEGGGNVTPMFGLAKKLMDAGHAVTILSEPCLEKPVRAMGASFIPFKKHFTRTNRSEDLFGDWKASRMNNPIIKQVIFGPANDVIDACIAVIREKSIDLLVADVLIFPAIIAAEFLQIPKIVVFHMPEYLPGPNRPPGNLGLKPGEGFFYRLRDRLLGRLMVAKFDEFRSALNHKLTALSLPPLKHTIDLFERAELRLIQTLRRFDHPIEPSPANVRYTGPVLDDPDWASNARWESPWSQQAPRPLVVVSFSSTFQNQHRIIQKCIDALAGLPVYGCVTLGPAMGHYDFSLPDNVVTLSSIKHSLLFPHADLVITHGGHGTIMRALSYGIPLICMPMGRDQYDNALSVELSGCGINISAKASSSKIRSSVEHVLLQGTYRNNVEHMREQIKSNEGMDAVIAEINDLILANQNKRKALNQLINQDE